MTRDTMNDSPQERSTLVEYGALVLLGGFTLFAVIGYGWFGLDPSRLPDRGFSRQLYNVSFQFFAQAHILLALGVILVPMARRSGVRLLVPLLAVALVSFVSEHIGTGYGIPFGGYAYTGLLGVRIGPRVPALIPISWFLMAVPAWILARAVISGRGPGPMLGRIALGSAWLVIWDLALDPAMSYLTPYWRWEETGPYYGMPWMNLVGWYVTGIVLMLALDLLSDWARLDRLSTRWMAGFYGAMVLMPLGMLAAAGEWLAVVVTLVAVATFGFGSRVLTRTTVPARARSGAAESVAA
jgi:uncharacterized membrane protein